VKVDLTFCSPLLPQDLDLLARPVTYLAWQITSTDGLGHSVQLYFEASGLLCVDQPGEQVTAEPLETAHLQVLRAGTTSQLELANPGDDRRINWGYFYLAAPAATLSRALVTAGGEARQDFVESGSLAEARPITSPLPATAKGPVLACAFDCGKVKRRPVKRHVLLAYDELHAIEYFGRRLLPYWKRKGATALELLEQAEKDYSKVLSRCAHFDEALYADLESVGGVRYARLCELVYRQVLAGNGLAADASGKPLLFPKENTSNGCMATVDVIYPQSPLFLALSPALVRAMLEPVFQYAASSRWKFPFAPHDLGTYPVAAGQVYGGGETSEAHQMPVEESANCLLLVDALCQAEGNWSFAEKWKPLLLKWARYLESKGLDPAHQLCTDDFAGPSAHNANLSLKAILALGAFAQIAAGLGEKELAGHYGSLAAAYAARWLTLAADEGHTRFAFDQPGTWSTKYNLVWDEILDLRLFPDSLAANELAWYRKVSNEYGFPLDFRHTYAKLDWELWAASLAPTKEAFEPFLVPLYDFLNHVPQRNPVCDLYDTVTGEEVAMHARPVMGGAFIRLLKARPLWRKWAKKAKRLKGPWAPFPQPRAFSWLLPTAERRARYWRYTFVEPKPGWYQPAFDDSAWPLGRAGFGREGTPGALVNTPWSSSDIWLRTTFKVHEVPRFPLAWRLHHDEDVEVYLNGEQLVQLGGFTRGYLEVPFSQHALACLKQGENVLAVHCRQTWGGQYVDVGIIIIKDVEKEATR